MNLIDNPALALWLIREKKATNFGDFMEYCGWARNADHSGHYHVRNLIGSLLAKGLITLDGNELKNSNFTIPIGVLEILSTLKISLKEAANRNNNSILVNPIFNTYQNKKLQYDIFVLMPFKEEMKPVYQDHIKNVAKKLSKTIARADDFFSVNTIMEEVCQAIFQSKVLIADCTGMNPNVFYELGLAHTLGKKVVLITQNEKDIPFDIRHIRYLKYEYTPRGMKEFEKSLYTFLQEVDGELSAE